VQHTSNPSRARAAIRLLGGAALTAMAALGFARDAGAQAAAPDYLYVCNQDGASVSVIDIGRLEVVRTIRLTELGFSDHAKPHHIVVEPDGSYWYLSLIGENRILKLDREDRIVGQAEMETPGLLSIQAGGPLLFAGRSMSAVNPPKRIAIIDRATMKIDEVDVPFPRPHALDIHPDGAYVYAASLGVNQLAALEVETERIGLVSLDGENQVLGHGAMAPDGRTLAMATAMPHVLFFDLSDPANPRLDGSVDVGQTPWHPIYSDDGRTLYVPDKDSNDIAVVDSKTRKVAKTITGTGISEPYGSALSPDGRYVFFSNNNAKGAYASKNAADPSDIGTVAVIDTRTNELVRILEVGKGPTGMGTRHAR